jgi:hypothetical protein
VKYRQNVVITLPFSILVALVFGSVGVMTVIEGMSRIDRQQAEEEAAEEKARWAKLTIIAANIGLGGMALGIVTLAVNGGMQPPRTRGY